MKGISRVSKELNIETHLLRDWEKRNWLGDVLKDPEQNNQRVYDDEQVERIKFIWSVIQDQRQKGFKRTDIQEVEEKLLDKFGGMVKPYENNITIRPGSIDQIVELIQMQNNKIAHLESVIADQKNLSPDHTNELQEIQKELHASKKREEKQAQTVDEMNEKLQKAVDVILKLEDNQEKQKKKSFWSKIFGE